MTPLRRLELLLPGFVFGITGGMVAGGLAALADLPAGYVVATTLGLGLPLALAGAGYNGLLAAGRVRLGGVTPAAVYWVVCFPLARTIHEFVLDVSQGRPLGLSPGPLQFLGFQAMVSLGFAVGFVWLHERMAPLWWVHIRHRNPVAQHYVDAYVQQAVMTERRKEARARSRTRRGTPNPGARRWR